MIRYSVAIFLSAWLVFSIQPLTARYLLPAFGGTAMVWTASMMFYQIGLLLGYLYAHALRTMFQPRVSWMFHQCGLLAALLLLRFSTLEAIEPNEHLVLGVVTHLSFAVGIPFLTLSGTAPLVQAWFSTTENHKNTYRLYAFSNAGSLLALVSYPFAVESFSLAIQSKIWQVSFVFLVILMAIAGTQLAKYATWPKANQDTVALNEISLTQVVCWCLLAATASACLMATTNVLCLEVASYPFLWVLPLTLYLISFVICFEWPNLYRRRWVIPVLVGAFFGGVLLLHLGPNANLSFQSFGFGAVIFAVSMACHGELHRIRPSTGFLTLYYVCIALGSALGSIFAVVVAPRVFDHYYEFHISLLVCLLILSGFTLADFFASRLPSVRWLYAAIFSCIVAASPVACSWLFLASTRTQKDLVFRERNEYGIVTIRDQDGYRKMFNGKTHHGGQFLNTEKKWLPSAYYSSGSGADLAFSNARSRQETLAVGVIGLGTGSLLSYAKPNDKFRFYEINPLAVDSAKQHFSYLSNHDSPIIIGDGRQQLKRELANGKQHAFDLIFVDAFSSDSIPVHLLTQECVELYLRHLSDSGILVFHITNKFVDLLPVLKSVNDEFELVSCLVLHENLEFDLRTRWVLMTKNSASLRKFDFENAHFDWAQAIRPVAWTDEVSSLAPLVNWAGRIDSGE